MTLRPVHRVQDGARTVLRRTRPLLAVAFLAAPFVLLACGGKSASNDTAAKPPPPAERAAQKAAAPADAGKPPGPAVEYGENDFVESDRNRDPFRSFAAAFVAQGPKAITRQLSVILPQYSIDELTLVAIQTGGDLPRAMVLDPTKKGWVLKRGDYVGRPDVVHTGGTNGVDYQLNWRVDRVRDGDVVLTREDPAQPGIAPATRVLLLHPEADKAGNESTNRN